MKGSPVQVRASALESPANSTFRLRLSPSAGRALPEFSGSLGLDQGKWWRFWCRTLTHLTLPPTFFFLVPFLQVRFDGEVGGATVNE